MAPDDDLRPTMAAIAASMQALAEDVRELREMEQRRSDRDSQRDTALALAAALSEETSRRVGQLEHDRRKVAEVLEGLERRIAQRENRDAEFGTRLGDIDAWRGDVDEHRRQVESAMRLGRMASRASLTVGRALWGLAAGGIGVWIGSWIT